MPQRLQRKRVKNFRLADVCTNPNGYRCVTRGTEYGNPFKVGERVEDESVPNGYWFIDEVHCLELFEMHVNAQLLDDPHWLDPLRGKDLACFCPLTSPCHADVLLRLANS
jgi:hypothetical protein